MQSAKLNETKMVEAVPDNSPVVRLGCNSCDSSHDGITQQELGRLIQDGWTEVEEVQSYEESIFTPDEIPQPIGKHSGFNVMNWETHLGWCPECTEKC